ncbi:hypothetical protein C9341_25290 [Escherichia coli]|nr:hypothetical protein C9343_25000 [Escherichia coli]TIZ15669.1 hypothetical protein C9341_25290 [Escherichia coli]TJE32694.1 hypothetical protein C9217_24770 [Escherichia coli]
MFSGQDGQEMKHHSIWCRWHAIRIMKSLLSLLFRYGRTLITVRAVAYFSTGNRKSSDKIIADFVYIIQTAVSRIYCSFYFTVLLLLIHYFRYIEFTSGVMLPTY